LLNANDYIVLRALQLDNSTAAQQAAAAPAIPMSQAASMKATLSPSVPEKLRDVVYYLSIMID